MLLLIVSVTEGQLKDVAMRVSQTKFNYAYLKSGFTARDLMWGGLRWFKKIPPTMVGRRRTFFAQKRSETLKQLRFYFKMYFFYSIFTKENNSNIHVSDENVFTSNGMKIRTK